MDVVYNEGASTSKAVDQQEAMDVDTKEATITPVDLNIEKVMQPINSKAVIEWEKGKKFNNAKNKDLMQSCKVLKFSTGWTYKEAMKGVLNLKPDDFPNLILIIMNVTDVPEDVTNNKPRDVKMNANQPAPKRRKLENNPKTIDDFFAKFCKSRQIIVQLTSKEDGLKRIFYNKKDSMDHLVEVKKKLDGSVKANNFEWFLLKFLSADREAAGIDDYFFSLFKDADELTLRCLTIFDFPREFTFRVASHCAAKRSISELFAVIGVPFEDKNGNLTEDQATIISSVYEGRESGSLLKAAIENAIKKKNYDIFNYLKGPTCSFCIAQLPENHQKDISDYLARKGEFEMLCGLLESSDFLFPTNAANIRNEKFLELSRTRNDIHGWIRDECEDNEKKLRDFVLKNSEGNQLRFLYNSSNETALYTAFVAAKETKNFEIIKYMIKSGFKKVDDKEFLDTRYEVMMMNVEKNSDNTNKQTDLLTARSRIFGKPEDISKLRAEIKSGLEIISKTKYGKFLINAAAQCEKLQIVFDFESDRVARVDFDSDDADGIMYPSKRLIIIGAQHSETTKDKHRVYGVLAHELAHYVFKLLYKNSEHPYYNESDPRYQTYKKIVDELSKYKDKEDGFDGIISSVFQCYPKEQWHAELIVRFFQIQVHFHNNKRKLKEAKKKFKALDNFTGEMIEEMKKLSLKGRHLVNCFNKYAEFLSEIRGKKLPVRPSEEVESLLNEKEKKLSIVTSNVPKLALIAFYNHLKERHGNLVGGKNVFVNQEKLSSRKYLNVLKSIIKQKLDVNFVLDFSSGNFEVLKKIDIPADRNFIIIVKDEIELINLEEYLKRKEFGRINLTYNYDNLMDKAKKLLLQYKVAFQDNQKVSLHDTLHEKIGDFSSVLTPDVIDMILKNKEIKINPNVGLDENKNFQTLFCERYFMSSDKKNELISQQDLIDENKENKFILISDVGGSGKSWTMKNLALAHSNSTDWVTFVDLKQFKQNQANFESFIADEVLKKKTSLEKEIFKHKYQKGQVKIFFDGFDEIVTDCDKDDFKSVSDMINSFESNNGNQLFISTRDYFKGPLQEKLNTERSYSLSYFGQGDGIELIATVWCLEKEKFENHKYEENKIRAKNLIENLPRYSIGLPQIYAMIAKLIKEGKILSESSNMYELYDKMCGMNDFDCLTKKGDYRLEWHIQSRKEKLNSLKNHELIAMQRFAPEREKYCDLNSGDKWPDTDLLGCGLMSKKTNGEFYFNHETFYEYFVAEFIIRNLKDEITAKEAFEFLFDVISSEKHEVIRRFLDEALEIENQEVKIKMIKLNARSSQAILLNPGKICEVFIKNFQNLDSLGGFMLEVLKEPSYESFIDIFVNGLENIIRLEMLKASKNNKDKKVVSSCDALGEKLNQLYGKYQEKVVDLINSCIEIKTLEDIAERINEINKSKTFFKEVLKYVNKDGQNILMGLVRRFNFKKEKYEKFLKFLKIFMTQPEIVKMIEEKDHEGFTINFHAVVSDHVAVTYFAQNRFLDFSRVSYIRPETCQGIKYPYGP